AREVERARRSAYTSAIAALDGDTSPLADAIRVELQALLARSQNDDTSQFCTDASSGLRITAVNAPRQTLLQMRSSAAIGEDAFHQLEEEIDRLELSAA